MMKILLLENGDLVRIKSTTLPQATFIKIQPQSVDFLDISDPKAVLENALRNFSALTVNDIFAISYNDHIYEIQVLEAKPENEMKAISVVETDLEVDFAPPIGYVEPEYTPKPKVIDHENVKVRGAIAAMLNYDAIVNLQAENQSSFKGAGQNLNGKAIQTKKTTQTREISTITGQKIPAPLNVPFGTLFFGYDLIPYKNQEEQESEEKQSKFKGEGTTLRKTRKNAADDNSN